MDINSIAWQKEPWIKGVTRDAFVTWGVANGIGVADELGALYDSLVPPVVVEEDKKSRKSS